MSKQIYIHVGVTKTGTTAIQKFLWINRKLLERHGFGVLPTFESKKFSGLFVGFPEWQDRMKIKSDAAQWKKAFLKRIKSYIYM